MSFEWYHWTVQTKKIIAFVLPYVKRILGMYVKRTCNEGLWYEDAFLRLVTNLASVSPIFWSLWSKTDVSPLVHDAANAATAEG